MKTNRMFRKAIYILLVLCIACLYFSTTASAAEEDTDTDTAVSIMTISGVTAPVTGETPVTEITETAQYTGTITWSPNDTTFVGGRAYSANITLTPKDGYTLTDVTKNYFTVSGAASVSNAAGSGFTTAVFPTTAISGGSIHYVNISATGANTGTSWADAYTDLQSAITASDSGDQIWVAAGTYTPAASDRAVSFAMKDGVALFGGFAGTETEFSERDYKTNVTILSGDLSGNDDFSDIDGDGFDKDDFSNCTENSYRVITCAGLGSSAVLDGFTIQGGFNNRVTGSPTTGGCGGGIYMYQSNTTLSNLIICYNAAVYFGSGIYMTDGTNQEISDEMGSTIVPFSPVLTNVTITMNSYSINYREISGTGIYNKSGDPILTHVTIDQNEGKVEGAGMISYGDPILTDVTFINNFGASVGGGGMTIYTDNYGDSSTEIHGTYLRNVTFTGNTTFYKGAPRGGYMGVGGGLLAWRECYLTDVTFTGNTATQGGGMFGGYGTMNHVTFNGNKAIGITDANSLGGGYHEQGASTFNDVVFTNNEATYGGGMYLHRMTKSTLTDINYTGNTAQYGGGLFVDAGSSSTISLSNLTFTENHASIDGGGMFNAQACIDLNDTTFTKNTADGNGGGLMSGDLDITEFFPKFKVTLTGVSFDQNSAGANGGGFFAIGGYTSVYSSSFTDNTAGGRGGGYCNADKTTTYSDGYLITNSVFSGNSAKHGGGLAVLDQSTYVTDTLFCNNTATGNGGGIYVFPYVLICNVTIADNTAGGAGGGMYLGGHYLDEVTTNPSAVVMANSIIWGNTGETCGGMYFNNSKMSDMDHSVNNIIQGTGGKPYDPGVEQQYEYDLGSNMIVDPQFAGDGSYRLKDSSPGIDTGNAHVYKKIPPSQGNDELNNMGYGMYISESGERIYIDREVSDLDGNSRLVNGYYDLGAYERQDVGSISGTVTDQSGTPLSGAAVTVSDCGYTATTAADGTYTVLAVKAGTSHTVTAAFTGYPNATASNVSVTANQTTPSVNLVVDNAAPTVSGVTPNGTGAANSGNIVVTFNEAMDTTAGTVSFDGGTTALTGGTWSKNNTVYTAAYSDLDYTTEYRVTISGFKDGVGNEMETDNSHTFTTAAANVDECFIATAAFGSKFQPAVVLLRHFRDQYLLTNRIGLAFVKFYYHNSPPIAQFIGKSETLKALVRFLLVPFISFVYLVYHPLLGVTTMVFGIIIILYARKRRFHLFSTNI